MKSIIESPFKNADQKVACENLIYLNMVARKLSIEEKRSVLFFHSFYTQFLNDNDDNERLLGLEQSFVHHDETENRIITVDRGISTGMKLGMERGLNNGAIPEFFTLCSPDTEVGQLVSELNQISDPTQRWSQGYPAITGLLGKLNKQSNYGDKTDYMKLEENCTLRKEVKGIIQEFFAPLVEHN